MRFKIGTYFRYLFPFVLMLLLLAGCSGPKLGEEFALSPGQSVVIPGEDLRIKFLEVTEDSRCPQGVTCIWAGQVSCLIEIGDVRSSEQLKLTRLGGTAEFSSQVYNSYTLYFDVQPYPIAGESIAKEDYRLTLIVAKQTGR